MDLLDKIRAKLYQQFDLIRNRKQKHPPRVSIEKGNNRRCLFCYLSAPLQWKNDDPRLNWHENLRQSRQIAEILTNNGYDVDIIDIHDDQFVPEKHYDLFIGHGINAKRILNVLNPECKKIYLGTGQYAPYANQQTKKRYDQLLERSGKHLTIVYPSSLTKTYYELFDAIICFANDTNIETFEPLNIPVYGFPNYANPYVKFINSSKKKTNHFVYIAAGNHIRKGLDLLLEIFASHSNWHLHICGRIDNEVKAKFSEELSKTNVHCYNNIDLTGTVFAKICRKATFYISPSSSEGMQGAALNAMAAGLIPIITKDVGVDLFECGYIIQDSSIPKLTEQIKQCSKIDDITQKKLMNLALEIVNKHYRPKNFEKKWDEIIKQLS